MNFPSWSNEDISSWSHSCHTTEKGDKLWGKVGLRRFPWGRVKFVWMHVELGFWDMNVFHSNDSNYQLIVIFGFGHCFKLRVYLEYLFYMTQWINQEMLTELICKIPVLQEQEICTQKLFCHTTKALKMCVKLWNPSGW